MIILIKYCFSRNKVIIYWILKIYYVICDLILLKMLKKLFKVNLFYEIIMKWLFGRN